MLNSRYIGKNTQFAGTDDLLMGTFRWSSDPKCVIHLRAAIRETRLQVENFK